MIYDDVLFMVAMLIALFVACVVVCGYAEYVTRREREPYNPFPFEENIGGSISLEMYCPPEEQEGDEEQ